MAQANVDLKLGRGIGSHDDSRGKLGDDNGIEQEILALDSGRFRMRRAPKNFLFVEAPKRTWSVVMLNALDKRRGWKALSWPRRRC